MEGENQGQRYFPDPGAKASGQLLGSTRLNVPRNPHDASSLQDISSALGERLARLDNIVGGTRAIADRLVGAVPEPVNPSGASQPGPRMALLMYQIEMLNQLLSALEEQLGRIDRAI